MPVMVTVSVLVVSVLVQVLIVITFLGSVTVLGSEAAVVTTVVLGAGITSGASRLGMTLGTWQTWTGHRQLATGCSYWCP